MNFSPDLSKKRSSHVAHPRRTPFVLTPKWSWNINILLMTDPRMNP